MSRKQTGKEDGRITVASGPPVPEMPLQISHVTRKEKKNANVSVNPERAREKKKKASCAKPHGDANAQLDANATPVGIASNNTCNSRIHS